MAIALQELIETDIDRMPNGLPIEPPSMRNRSLVTLPGNKQERLQKCIIKKPSPLVTKVTLPFYGLSIHPVGRNNQLSFGNYRR